MPKNYLDDHDMYLDFDPVYRYSSPVGPYGIRKWCGVVPERHVVRGMDGDGMPNFEASQYPGYDNPKCLVPMYPMFPDEGFGDAISTNILFRLLIFIIVIAIVWYILVYNK